MQDTGAYYFGALYTYSEIVSNADAPFKFRALIEHYISKDTDPDTSIESHLYYLTKDMFSARTLIELKAKVKVDLEVTQKSFFGLGAPKRVYREKIMPITELMDISVEEKKKLNVKIAELVIPKLSLMGFSI